MIRASAYADISTHSLTRRLTAKNFYAWWTIEISTHSLTRRLTRNPVNPPITALNISTHSLTRRLTEESVTAWGDTVHFNSQPHKEADCIGFFFFIVSERFQLTASQGG